MEIVSLVFSLWQRLSCHSGLPSEAVTFVLLFSGCCAVKVPASFHNYEGSLFPAQKNLLWHTWASPTTKTPGESYLTSQFHFWCCLILIFRSIPPSLISSKSLCAGEVPPSSMQSQRRMLQRSLNETTQFKFQQEKQTAYQSKSSQAASPPSPPWLWSKTG